VPSAQVQWPPYLELGGVEIANAARTLEYMLRLGQEVGFRVTEQPIDLYPYLYFRAGRADFIAPGVDPAPWFNPAEPASAQFLGVLLNRPLALGSTSSREIVALEDGATFNAEVLAGRALEFTGQLISLDSRGQAFGMRWLSDTLASACTAGQVTTLSMYDRRPPDDDFDEGWWTFYNVAQTEGVTQTEDAPAPYVTPISFTLTAGNPRFFRPYEMIIPAEVLDPNGYVGGQCIAFCEWLNGDPGPQHSTSIDAPTYGETAAVITIDSPGGVGAVEILVHNSSQADDPNSTLEVSGLPPGTQFVLDAAQEICAYVDPDGFAWDGTSLLNLDEGRTIPWEWLRVAWCDESIDLIVQTAHPRSYGQGATVQIESAARSR